MTVLNDLVDLIRLNNIKPTVYDIGKGLTATFVLAVVFDERLDIWYLSKIFGEIQVTPVIEGNIMYFPQLIVGADSYKLICEEN